MTAPDTPTNFFCPSQELPLVYAAVFMQLLAADVVTQKRS